jgi:hypothetical protein
MNYHADRIRFWQSNGEISSNTPRRMEGYHKATRDEIPGK